ncbi:MAG: FAD-binding protein [Halioglobus sp.]
MNVTDVDHWDHEFDVVVVGSGNGALTAAIAAADGGATTLVIEKSDHFGGTSASSGGGVWIPNNRYAKAEGADDSLEDARAYLNHVTPADTVNPALLETYLTRGPEVINYLHDNTQWVRYRNLAYYPDYFPDGPGGKTGNRSMEPEPLHADALGEDFQHLAPQHPQTQMPGGINFTQVEGAVVLAATRGWFALAAKLVLKYLTDFPTRFKTLRDARLTMGNAGVARLFLAVRDRNIPVWRSTSLLELVNDNDRVVGIVVERNGRREFIRTQKGVVLAAGGFERNQKMREQYLPSPTNTQWSAGNLQNTGDAIVAAQQLGAETAQMDWGWWFTTATVPGKTKAYLSQVEKGMAGSITVNKKGKRFSNESQNYVSFVADMIKDEDNIPSYMIFDADFRRQRPVASVLIQGKFFPDWMIPGNWWTPEFLSKADSLSQLAEKVGIDPEGLQSTVAAFNQFANDGQDDDFQRGDSSYDRYYADPEVTPNPCLAPLLKPPFYALALYPGEMGTAGGLVIDEHARVKREDGTVIEGLYACGNTTAALLPAYPGPGATLGPAMVFGFLAGENAAAG